MPACLLKRLILSVAAASSSAAPWFVYLALEKWNLTFEANGGTDYVGRGRLGLVWNTSFGEGNALR